MAEFAISNQINTSTDMTLFFANHGFHSRTSIEPPGTFKGEQKIKLLVADKIVARQGEMIEFFWDQLVWLQDEQTWFANRTRQTHLEYKVGDKVYVDARHFASERDKKSLDLKNAGLWKII